MPWPNKPMILRTFVREQAEAIGTTPKAMAKRFGFSEEETFWAWVEGGRIAPEDLAQALKVLPVMVCCWERACAEDAPDPEAYLLAVYGLSVPDLRLARRLREMPADRRRAIEDAIEAG